MEEPMRKLALVLLLLCPSHCGAPEAVAAPCHAANGVVDCPGRVIVSAAGRFAESAPFEAGRLYAVLRGEGQDPSVYDVHFVLGGDEGELALNDDTSRSAVTRRLALLAHGTANATSRALTKTALGVEITEERGAGSNEYNLANRLHRRAAVTGTDGLGAMLAPSDQYLAYVPEWVETLRDLGDAAGAAVAANLIGQTQDYDRPNYQRTLPDSALAASYVLSLYGGFSRIAALSPAFAQGLSEEQRLDLERAMATAPNLMVAVQLLDTADWAVPIVFDVLSFAPGGACAGAPVESLGEAILKATLANLVSWETNLAAALDEGFSDPQAAQRLAAWMAKEVLTLTVAATIDTAVTCVLEPFEWLLIAPKLLDVAALGLDLGDFAVGAIESWTTGLYAEVPLPFPPCVSFDGDQAPATWTCNDGSQALPCAAVVGVDGAGVGVESAIAYAPEPMLAGSFDLAADVLIEDGAIGDFNALWGAADTEVAFDASLGDVSPTGDFCAVNLYPAGSDSSSDTIACKTASGYTVVASAPSIVAAQSWYHVELTYVGTETVVRIDGAPHLAAEVPSSLSGAVGFRFWQRGRLDNVCIDRQ
jgi:hypothetical protein